MLKLDIDLWPFSYYNNDLTTWQSANKDELDLQFSVLSKLFTLLLLFCLNGIKY